jgi:hypothetical protein
VIHLPEGAAELLKFGENERCEALRVSLLVSPTGKVVERQYNETTSCALSLDKGPTDDDCACTNERPFRP